MKTLQILDKYRKIISGILNCKPEEINFIKDNEIIGELKHSKSEEEARLYCEEQNITFNYDDFLIIQTDWSLGNYKIVFNDDIISTFKLYQLPHCCAFMVSCNVKVEENFRNKRIGTILNQLRQDLGRLLGYSAVLCTDIEQNINQRKLLKTNGWKDIHNVINKRTQNRVYLSVINI